MINGGIYTTIVYKKDMRSGITYAYDSKSHWDKEKQRSRSTQRLIGRVDPVTGEIVPTDGRNRKAKAKQPVKPSQDFSHKYYGATYLLTQLAVKTGLVQDLQACFGNLTDMILSIAEYLVLEPESTLYRFNHWQNMNVHPANQPISSQQSSDLFGHITEDQISNFFRRQSRRRIPDEYWAYDSTLISSYSQGLKQVRYGHNKEHDPLAQLNLLLVYGEQSGLPFYYRKLSGSIPDVKTVMKLLDDLEALDIDKTKLVMDRAFYSKANVDALLGQHLKFLIGIRTGIKLVRTNLLNHMEELHQFQNCDDNSGVYGTTVMTEWSYEQVRRYKQDTLQEKRRVYLHLYFNNDRHAEDVRVLDKRLGELYHELQTRQHLEAHAKDYAKFFEVKTTPKRGRQVTPKDETIKQAKQFCGYWALLTHEKMTASQALHIYRSKDIIEKGFGNIKDRLNGRRLLVSSEKSLNGKIFVQFIGLILVAGVNQVMHSKQLYRQYSLQQLLDRLDEVEQFTAPGRAPKVREVQADQAGIYDSFDIINPVSL
ncbi:IS1634 family transposase [Lacticaseibacillus paracasei]|uniref:IS1634 family transposase n=2 Tax=Lacticaseibacillus paracasei TaxID=1597 RepID=UPI000F0BD176|nr:Transposase [Lacticaseibacillus paracasei]